MGEFNILLSGKYFIIVTVNCFLKKRPCDETLLLVFKAQKQDDKEERFK